MEIPDMGWVMNKALFALFCIQAIWILTSWTVLEIIIKRTIPDLFEDQLISNLLILGVISIFNYFTLIYKKKWFKYDEEFASYSKTKNKVINITIFLFYIISFTLFFVGVEIWANLGHAGKIEGF